VKPSRARLKAHVATWTAKLGSPIPAYAYHFTHLDNAVRILADGEILSRAECLRRGIAFHNSASPAVISKTTPVKLRFVRLYFRPKTPTQWHCEGIRPPSGITDHRAHCPIPVFFLYDLVDLLSRPTTMFSDGNMGSGSAKFDDSAAFFDSIAFEHVYHEGVISQESVRAVVHRRHAEVLVPDALSLNGLQHIYCRSHAERRTLLHELQPAIRAKWANKIKVSGGGLFFRRWAFVEDVAANADDVTFSLNPLNHLPHHLQSMNTEFAYQSEGKTWFWSGNWPMHQPLNLNLNQAGKRGVASLKIEGHQAFAGELVLDDLPF
jgi:hypothetical protein